MGKRQNSSLPRNVGGVKGAGLGNESDDADNEMNELSRKIANTRLPEHARIKATKELKAITTATPTVQPHPLHRALDTCLS